MSAKGRSTFVYVTYIRTTQKKLWAALTDPKFIRQYWFGMSIESEWTQGASWRMAHADGRVTDSGRIVEIDPPHRMVIKWQHELHSAIKAEGPGRCTIELEPAGKSVKLTITHVSPRNRSKLISAVSGGWPLILSNLKSLLETGAIAIADSGRPGHR